MRVRFARWLAASFLGTGALLGVLTVLLWRDQPGVLYPVLAATGFLVLTGILYSGPMAYVTISESQIRVATVGRWDSLALKPRDRIETGGGRLVVRRFGQAHRVPAYRRYAHPRDWDAMVKALAANGGLPR
ncbi:hypothetical protein [Cryptosporangium aurantiacum]|uniref:Uncharacterized protein n=1 Tax=Cryptosporangium aurantiacum TaxID=134849 RepID=A0A1M7RKE8_9ACTN|nr:hypothetical protein [Cryptosporangium aurantiacum]SHN46631.1 hypothetical protein SAMN05443668_11714 [Cryptosporangium aurantiacum]